jgi:hypothetical protein
MMPHDESRFSWIETDDNEPVGAKKTPPAAPAPVTAPPTNVLAPTPAPVRPAVVMVNEPLPRTEDPTKSRAVVFVKDESETTGLVTLWQLSGDVSLDRLRPLWVAAGLDESLLPSYASDTVALTRAAKSLQGQRILVRKDPRPGGGWCVVREHASTSDGLTFAAGVRVLVKDGEIVVERETYSEEETRIVGDQVRAAYAHARSSLFTVDVSAWLVKLADKFRAVALVDRGGTYFVPRQEVNRWRAAKAALEGCSSHAVYTFPAMRSADAVKALVEAVGREARSLVESCEGEMAAGEGIGLRAARNRIVEIDALKTKLAQYEELVGQKMAGTEARLNELRKKLETTQTRFSSVETD